jgi:hypothetical protein
MGAQIDAETLTTFEVSGDGQRLRLHATDGGGEAVSMSLPAECLTQMVMTLPRMALAALRTRHKDNSLRLVYPASDWVIERSDGSSETFIVTLVTPDGFEVSFGFPRRQLEALEKSIGDATATPFLTPPLN